MTHQEYLKRVGLEIKVARIRKNLSIMDIVKITGLSKSAIGCMENGKKDSHILSYKRITDAIGIELKDVL